MSDRIWQSRDYPIEARLLRAASCTSRTGYLTPKLLTECTNY
jgi:hypothetical protein